MASSGSGGDKLRGNRSGSLGNKPSPVVSKRDDQVHRLENLFDITYSKMQELYKLLQEEKKLNDKVSDEGYLSALKNQNRLVQVSRVVLKRESFGTNAPWGHTPNKSSRTPKGAEKVFQKSLSSRHLPMGHFENKNREGAHGYYIPDQTFRTSASGNELANHSFQTGSPSFSGRGIDEEMFKRTGAIPKKVTSRQGLPFLPSNSTSDISFGISPRGHETIGHPRSKEDPGALRMSHSQHEAVSVVHNEEDDDGGFRNLGSSNSVHNPKMDPSWYGSLDRNFAKRKKINASDKQRRHTKTIGVLPWLPVAATSTDSVKNSNELGPDEQYTFGLPHVGNVHSPKLSTTILASLSHTLSPKNMGSRSQHYPYLPESNNFNHHMPADTVVHVSTPKATHTRPRQQGSIGSSVFVGSNRLPSPIPKHTPLNSGLHDNKMDTFSKIWIEKDMGNRPTSIHERSRSTVAAGVSPSPGPERIVSAFSNMQIGDSNSDVVDSATQSTGSDQVSSISKESTKPFEMADYYKYSTKFRSQHHSQSSGDATSGSQNERSRFSSSSASSASSAVDDSAFSARSLILKNFFMQLPYDENVDMMKGSVPTGENNSWVPPHLKDWYSFDFKTQLSILENYVRTEESGQNDSSQISEMNSSNVPSTSSSNISANRVQSGLSTNQIVLPSDENGNKMCSTDQAPELPPRQPRDRKDGIVEGGRGPENKNQAWIMDTPTFV